MKEHEIIAAIRTTANFDSEEHARRAARATLSVLGERLAGGETGDLAAQLPPGLADALPAVGSGDPFDLDEFYRLVAVREGEGCTQAQARQHSRALMSALRSSVTPGEIDDLVSQLPREYEDLLGTGPVLH